MLSDHLLQYHAAHNNRYRLLNSPDAAHVGVNDMVMHMYWSKYETPTLSEGYEQVVNVQFVPKFDTAAQRHMYGLYLVEK